jgi:hypothetical protein
MFLKELLIKDNIIKNSEGLRDTYYQIAKELKTQLKIPRLHLEFLKTKGTLDHFVRAKLQGKDEQAKWTLLRAGEKEISSIEKQNEDGRFEQAKIDARRKNFKLYGMMDKVGEIANSQRSKTYRGGSLEQASARSLESSESPSVRAPPTRQSSKNVLPGSFRRLADAKVFDINFKEMLRDNLPRVPQRKSTRFLEP